ncbi:hypothetical protein KCP73_14545 [Salmonella enterica subsp. enterica]|nr:hypothetical protein KCP73_14545 [Salmonella enterica subsp. enterica]
MPPSSPLRSPERLGSQMPTATLTSPLIKRPHAGMLPPTPRSARRARFDAGHTNNELHTALM